MMKILAYFFLLLITLCKLQGQEIFTNTRQYHDSIGSPNAQLSQLNWISGYWRGEAFGGKVEEVWTPQMGGTMMCTFKLVIDDKIQFYELATISEENQSLILRLKHFHKDLKGWEAKDRTIDFKLVEVKGDRVYFDGFTFEKDGDNAMNIFVVIESNASKKEVKFTFTRKAL